ncbi:hypothetical protein HALLA_20370 (plasmid) [Halostagnicola larsenii XH-48]|uniref:Uncharacterized protein n=1 Tax=Halostagnicola larsenii XH-48 TaxID=797299 RepID=W0JUM0_9EURY|nr:hypothetical protein HALLA_20370 [Halostagnicola larsenii XH-48]
MDSQKRTALEARDSTRNLSRTVPSTAPAKTASTASGKYPL